jgi:hypothetical protein
MTTRMMPSETVSDWDGRSFARCGRSSCGYQMRRDDWRSFVVVLSIKSRIRGRLLPFTVNGRPNHPWYICPGREYIPTSNQYMNWWIPYPPGIAYTLGKFREFFLKKKIREIFPLRERSITATERSPPPRIVNISRRFKLSLKLSLNNNL